MLKKIYYTPGDWLANRFSPRGRRAFATWLGILFVVSVPFQYPYKDAVWSSLALVNSSIDNWSARSYFRRDSR